MTPTIFSTSPLTTQPQSSPPTASEAVQMRHRRSARRRTRSSDSVERSAMRRVVMLFLVEICATFPRRRWRPEVEELRGPARAGEPRDGCDMIWFWQQTTALFKFFSFSLFLWGTESKSKADCDSFSHGICLVHVSFENRQSPTLFKAPAMHTR